MAAFAASSTSLTVSKISAISPLAELSSNKTCSVRFGVAPFSSSLRATNLGQSNSNVAGSRQILTAIHAVEEDIDFSDASLSPPDAGTKLYVGNLPFNVDSAGLANYFTEAGVVDQVDVIYDRETGRSRGFAFVTMATTQDAEAAIENLDGRDFGGRTLRVGFPVAKNDRPPRTERPARSSAPQGAPGAGNKLYVGNLSWGMDDYGLADLFSEFGQVVEAKVVMDRETGKSRGFGFVSYATPTEGAQAVSSLDGAEVDGRTIRVSVAADRPPTGRGRF